MTKDSTLQFRLSDEEKKLIVDRARESGLTPSEYCRLVLTGIVLSLEPNLPTIAIPRTLNPPPDGVPLSVQRGYKEPPRAPSFPDRLPAPPPASAGLSMTPQLQQAGVPMELLKELKMVLRKYYVDE